MSVDPRSTVIGMVRSIDTVSAGRQCLKRTFRDCVLSRETGRHTVVAVVVEYRQHGRKRELNHSMRLECTPRIVDPVVDWHEAFSCPVRDVLHSH